MIYKNRLFLFVVRIIIPLYDVITTLFDARRTNRIKRMRNCPQCKNIKNIDPAIYFSITLPSPTRRSTSHLRRNHAVFLEPFNMISNRGTDLPNQALNRPSRKPIKLVRVFIHFSMLSLLSRVATMSINNSLLAPPTRTFIHSLDGSKIQCEHAEIFIQFNPSYKWQAFSAHFTI